MHMHMYICEGPLVSLYICPTNQYYIIDNSHGEELVCCRESSNGTKELCNLSPLYSSLKARHLSGSLPFAWLA